MREAVDRPDLFFEIFDKEKGEYRPLTEPKRKNLIRINNTKSKKLEKQIQV